MMRIQKTLEIAKEHNLDALMVDAPIDLYYLTGLELSLGRLIVTPEKSHLFVDGRYFEQCQKNTTIEVHLTQGYGEGSTFKALFSPKWKRVGFDAAYVTFQSFQSLSQLNCELIPLDAPIRQIRQIKDLEETEKLKKASFLASKGFDYVLTLLEEGITEEEVATKLEIFWRKSGGKKVSFDPHIAFGSNTSLPHYRVGKCKLKKGDPVLIDIGVVVDHYHSDMTRVVFYKEASSKMEEIYRVVQKAQQEAIRICHPGTLIGDLDSAARTVIVEKGFGEFFTHSLGHGIGLEIHEAPTIRNLGPSKDQRLAPGMAITIEPGIYLPGVGGVRLEDSILITENGHENLTKRPLSKEIPII